MKSLFAMTAALLCSASVSAQIRTVQHAGGSGFNGSSVAVPFKANVTSGNVLFVAASAYAGQTITTPTDSQGNVYALAATATNPGNAVAAIYVTGATSTAANTVTCHIAGSGNLHCHIYEVAGVTTTLDASGTQLLSGSALSVSTAAATTNANDYVLSYFAADNSQLSFIPGAGYGNAETTASASNDSAFSEDSVIPAAAVQTATATASGSDAFAELIVAFKAAPPPGPSLILSPPSLSFAATAGTTPTSSTFNVSMSIGSASFSTTSDVAWLSVSPTSGTLGITPTTLTVDPSVLTTCPQFLTGHVTITAAGVGNSPQTEKITYTANCIQHSVQLTWAAPLTPPALDGYNVYRYVAGAGCAGPVTALNKSLLTTPAFADNTAQSGSTYCYYSTASSAGVESAPSNTFSVIVPTP